MTTTLDAPTTTSPTNGALPPAHRLPLRLHLLVRSVPVVLTALLGIPRETFYYRVKRLGIDLKAERQRSGEP